MPLPRAVKKPRSKKPRLSRWSYSAWSTYDGCPRKAKYRYLDRVPEMMLSPLSMNRGKELHSSAEWFLDRKSDILVSPLQPWKDKLSELREREAAAEEAWRFDTDFLPAENETWLKMIVDAFSVTGSHGRIVDYKSGKIYDSHYDQGHLYALGAFMREPHLDTVDTEFWYIDLKEVRVFEFARSEVYQMVKVWKERTSKMFADTNFYPKPGPSCKWCAFAKSRKGPCKYG